MPPHKFCTECCPMSGSVWKSWNYNYKEINNRMWFGWLVKHKGGGKDIYEVPFCIKSNHLQIMQDWTSEPKNHVAFQITTPAVSNIKQNKSHLWVPYVKLIQAWQRRSTDYNMHQKTYMFIEQISILQEGNRWAGSFAAYSLN